MVPEPVAAIRRKRAWLYYRVSTGKLEQDSSLDVQQILCRRLCEREGWVIVGESSDRKTGTKLTRTGFREAAAAIREKRADIIVAKSLSRFARTVEFAALLRELQAGGGDMVLVEGNFDTRTAAGRFNLAVQLAALQFTVEFQGEQIRDAKPIRREQGYHPSVPPFACRPVDGKPGVPEPDPEWWPWYLRILRWRGDEGRSFHWIADELRRLGLASWRGGIWNPSTVKRIVNNPFYVDERLLHTCKVDRELWERANETTWGIGTRAPAKYFYLLRGLVVNGLYETTRPERLAGQAMLMQPKPEATGNPYYSNAICNQKRYYSGHALPCEDGRPIVSIRADWLDWQVVERLILLGEDEANAGLRSKISDMYSGSRDELRAQALTIDKQIAAAEGVVRQRSAELLSAVKYDIADMVAALKLQREDAQREVDGLVRERERLLETAEQIRPEAATEDLRELNSTQALWLAGNFDGLQRLIRALVNRVSVRMYYPPGTNKPTGELEIVWHAKDYLAELGIHNVLPVPTSLIQIVEFDQRAWDRERRKAA